MANFFSIFMGVANDPEDYGVLFTDIQHERLRRKRAFRIGYGG